MDALTGALLASTVAWASILLARHVPFERALGERGLRHVAAASLAIVGLVLLGAPLSPWGAWGLLLAAVAAASISNLASKRRPERQGVTETEQDGAA